MRTVSGRFGRLTRQTSEDLNQHLVELEKTLQRDLDCCRQLKAITSLPIAEQPTINGLSPDLRNYLEFTISCMDSANAASRDVAQRPGPMRLQVDAA